MMKIFMLLCLAVQAAAFTPQVRNVIAESNIFSKASFAAAATSTSLLLPSVAAAVDEYEIAELPPVWIPAVVAVGCLVGVGLLTGSLGNVIDEESMLGLQSGARAKKEIERSTSSYFKKK